MLKSVKVLHIEVTNICNAACPQCARETDLAFNKHIKINLTVPQLKKIFNEDFIKGLDKMFMCGNYGDPAAGKHTLEIFKYFRSVNPNIILGMNTNGGVRSENWWRELAGILTQPRDYVVWSIDGLEDTNHIYRVNTTWRKIIKNVTAFIDAGGNAHWDMLVFAHNEHQLNAAQALAKQLKFKWFRTKVSKRFDVFPVTFLNPPTKWHNTINLAGPINCQALHEQSIYLSAQGEVYPCCWLGNTEYSLDRFNEIKYSWSTTPNPTCQEACTKNNTGTNFTNQWQQEIQFNYD